MFCYLLLLTDFLKIIFWLVRNTWSLLNPSTRHSILLRTWSQSPVAQLCQLIPHSLKTSQYFLISALLFHSASWFPCLPLALAGEFLFSCQTSKHMLPWLTSFLQFLQPFPWSNRTHLPLLFNANEQASTHFSLLFSLPSKLSVQKVNLLSLVSLSILFTATIRRSNKTFNT